jgi:hypothetical protein
LNINIVEAYLKRKTKYITRYAKTILKSVYKAQSDNTETIEKCVDTYFDYFVLNNYNDENVHVKVNDFYLKNKIEDKIRKEVTIVIFDTIPQLKTRLIDDEYNKNLILLINILVSAIKLEEYTTSLTGENINVNEALQKLQQHDGLFQGKEWNDIAKFKKELKTLVSDNVKTSKKILELFNKMPFYLDYYQLYDVLDSNNLYIEVELGHSKKTFADLDPKRVQETYMVSEVPDDHFLIILDKLMLLIFKGKIDKTNYSQFFVNLPSGFLKKKTNLKKLLNITTINKFKNSISLMIDGIQLEKYEEQVKQLIESGYNIAINDVSYLADNMGKIRLIAKYLFVDKEVLLKRMEIVPISEDAKIVLISKDKVKEAMLIDV